MQKKRKKIKINTKKYKNSKTAIIQKIKSKKQKMDQENFLELELDIDVTSHNELETCIEFKDSPQDSTDSDE